MNGVKERLWQETGINQFDLPTVDEILNEYLETQALALEVQEEPLDERLEGGSHTNLLIKARNEGRQQAADYLRAQKINK